MSEPLAFYEHSRQSYGGQKLRSDADHEWMVGGFGGGSGVDERGEFRVCLYIRRHRESWAKDWEAVRIECYTDAREALIEFLKAGAMDRLHDCSTPDEVNAALLACGFTDTSDYETRAKTCPCCYGQGSVTERDLERFQEPA